MRRAFVFISVIAVACSNFGFSRDVSGQDKNLIKLLTIKPRHQGADYDVPSRAELSKCSVDKPESARGYVVIGPSGRIIRQFLDNNKDDRLDQWSYYKDGIEVYRDVDTNFDTKADQHRWMGTAGIRWGLDRNQDGTIDLWRQISAEEVAAEVFEATKAADARRFELVLISDSEIASLNLGKKMTEVFTKSRDEARSKFVAFIKDQRKISPKSKWIHFGTSQPNLVPAGNEGIGNDVVIYDHASAVFQNGDDYEQLALGTIVQVGNSSWRVVELPQIVTEGQAVANGGIMFPMPEFVGAGEAVVSNPADERFARLFNELDELEKKPLPTRKSEIIARKKLGADLRVQLIENSRKQDRVNWIEGLADSVTDAYQNDQFPEGLQYLADYYKKLKAMGQVDGLDYIQWRMANTRFSKGVEGDRRKRAEATTRFFKDMEDFVDQHEESQFMPECLHNLGMHYEVANRQNPERAVDWYKKCARSFPDSDYGKKSAGAVVRLTGIGEPLSFQGRTADGGSFDLRRQKGKIVVIHYWATWCDICIKDFETLQRLSEKYKNDLIVIGANIDVDTADFAKFMRDHREVRWTQLHAPAASKKVHWPINSVRRHCHWSS